MASEKAFISIHTLRMEGDAPQTNPKSTRHISIHTLRMEGDIIDTFGVLPQVHISIHTLRMEGDCKSAQKISTLLFKSNRPAEKLPTGRA